MASGITGKQIRDDSLTGDDIDESTLNIEFPSFIVYGQSSDLTNQTTPFQARTTNGAQNGQGWRLPKAGKITHISVQLDCTSNSSTMQFNAQIYKNGTAITNANLSFEISGTGDFGATANFESAPFAFDANDRLTVYLSHGVTGSTTSNHAILIRVLC